MSTAPATRTAADPTGIASDPSRPTGPYRLVAGLARPAIRILFRPRVRGLDRVPDRGGLVLCSNQLSNLDGFALAHPLYPRQVQWMGKAELFRIPIFGHAARAAGMIPIQRDNRKSAFESYRAAAERIRAGASVVVFPEGTRGSDYRLREFKKGPFVLAVAAGVPIVPTIVHGTIEVMPRDSFFVRPHVVNVHFLEPIPADGLTYEDRNRLSRLVRDRMAVAMRDLYAIESVAPTAPAREGASAAD